MIPFQDSPAILISPGRAASSHTCACRTEHGTDFPDYTLIFGMTATVRAGVLPAEAYSKRRCQE